MRKIHVLFTILVCVLLIAACSKTHSDPPASTAAPTSIPTTEAVSSLVPTTEKKDIDENNANETTETNNEALNLINKAIENTKQLKSVSYTSESSEVTRYNQIEGSANEYKNETNYTSTFTGIMERDPAKAYFGLDRNVVSYEIKESNYEVTDEFTQSYTDYYDENMFYMQMYEDDRWYFGELEEIEFTTIERLEELLQCFANYGDQLMISEFEGNISIDLTLSKEQFANEGNLLVNTIFNGTYYKDDDLENLPIVADLLDYHYVSILLDDAANMVGYFLSFGTKKVYEDYPDEEITYFMVTRMNAHNKAVVDIPNEVTDGAIDLSSIAG